MHRKDDADDGNENDQIPTRPPRSGTIRSSHPDSPPPSRPPRKNIPASSRNARARQSVRISPHGHSSRSGRQFNMSTSELKKKYSHEMFVPDSYDLYDDTMTQAPTPPTRVSSSEHESLRAEMIAASQMGDYERAGVIQELLKAAELMEEHEEEEEQIQKRKERRKSATNGRELFMMNVVDNL